MSTSGSTRPVGRMICSTTTPPRESQLELARGGGEVDHLRHQAHELVELERPVVQRGGQPEAVLDQGELARAVAVEHPADLRERDVRLVHHHQVIRREVVDQAGGPLARPPPAQVPAVVLDAGAGADLEQHLDVEPGPRLEPLRLQQLARRAQLEQPLGQLGADELHRALDLGPLGDEVLRRVDGALVELGDGVAGERVDLADPLDLVAPELDPDRLLGVGREDLDRIAPDPEGALLEGDVVPAVLDPHQLGEHLVASPLSRPASQSPSACDTRPDRPTRRWRSRWRR